MVDEDGILRLAVWGAGIMGERVARSASSVDGMEVVAVVDRTEPRCHPEPKPLAAAGADF